MITRGHYIGEIIDEFSMIAAQVKLRNQLGLTDLTVFAENYIRDVLNALLKANLLNLNDARSNAPGLDLGDESLELGIQVTSTATAAKVNKTLTKITPVQAKKYKQIIVFIVGKRQASYKLDVTAAAKYKFTEENIWDMDMLARKALALELDQLQVLHRVVRKESARLRVELEIPDEEGRYPTNGFDVWEARVKPKIGTGDKFLAYLNEIEAPLEPGDDEKVRNAISKLAQRLVNLPRVTREFLSMLLEFREKKDTMRSRHTIAAHVLYGKVERLYGGADLKGELAILEHAEFTTAEYEDHELGAPEIFITMSRNDELQAGFMDFIENKGLSYRKVIGAVDLSVF